MGEPLRLYGLNALVLNAADGIGEAIARTLVKHGATVIAADTGNSGVEQHFRSVSGVTGQVANLTDPDSLAKLVETHVVEQDHIGPCSQGFADLVEPGGGGLAPIQALGGHFAGVVHPHQPGHVAPLAGILDRLVQIPAGGLPRGSRGR